MATTLILFLFFLFFFLEFFINWILDSLNKKAILDNPHLPSFFKDKIEEASFQKGRTYSLAKLQFSKWQMLYSSAMTLTLLFSGILPWLQSTVSTLSISSSLQGVVFFFILFAALGILQYPMGLYNTFKIEAVFGFNRATLRLYLRFPPKGKQSRRAAKGHRCQPGCTTAYRRPKGTSASDRPPFRRS